MAIKPFGIQGADLTLGGVNLQAGTTGVVIPGVTQATSYKVEEVEDTGDQTYNTYTNITVIDAALYNAIVEGGDTTHFADYSVELDDDGYIDDIEVNGQGTYTSGESTAASGNDMYAYIGTGTGGDRPLDPQDWIQIPFRPKMRAGAVETIGGGGGDGNQLVSNNNGNTFALMDEGDVVFDGEGPGGVDRGVVWQYGDNNDGYNSTVRQDEGGLTVRAYTENGGGGSTGTDGEGAYSAPVRIVTNQDLNQKTWTFDGAGALTFPDGTVQTTAYTGGSGSTAISKFVMVNNDGGVYGSDDGTNWNGEFNTGLTDINKVAVGPDMIVYIGNAGGPYTDLYYTTDWNVTPTLVGEIAPPQWNQVRYFASINKFVAVGSLDGVPTYKHSTDGITWTTVSLDGAWASGLNGGAGPGSASFTDIAVNNTGGFLLTTNNTVLGSFYTTALTSISTIGSGEHLDDGMDFQEVVYSTNGGFSGWFAFGNGNLGVDDGWWLNSSSNPAGGSFSNSWGINDISLSFKDHIGYEPGWSEITIGRTTGASIDTIMIASEDGQILYWPAEPAGPWLSIPKPYTNTDFTIENAQGPVITFTGEGAHTGEKIVITGAGDFNGTFYVGAGNVLYTDIELTNPVDSQTWATFAPGGTVTFSHGTYIDALNYASGKFYAANDDEEVFVSADGGETWTEVAALNPGGGEQGDGTGTDYMNDIDGYVGEAVNYQLVNGAHSFTLNNDGTITAPTLTVNLHNGGNQEGQVLQFGDTQQQVIITGPTPTGNDSAQRLIIQGQHGSGTGEGGDVYFWAGDADTNGGDIKIYAGDADNGSSGSGGYVNIDGGNGYSAGGNVTITGGSSTVNGGNVTISGGGGSTPGKVQIQSLYSQWQFKPDGTLQLPTGGDIVDSNGTSVLGGGSGGIATNGFDILTDGTKQATVTEQEVVTYNNELISGIPEFLSTAARSPDRQTLDTHYGFDGTGMWFTGDNQKYYDGDPAPAYPVFTAASFPSNAKAVVTFIFTLTDGNEDPGICFYPANGVPYWDWEPHPSRIAIMMDNEVPTIQGLTKTSQGPNIITGGSYRGQVTYDPVAGRTTFDVIDLTTGRVVTSVWQDVRLPEGEAYRIGFDADWDEATPGDKSYFSDLTIAIGDDNLEVTTEFTLTKKVKLPSSVKGQINLEGPWRNSDDDIFYHAVTTHLGNAYIIGSDQWNNNNQLQLYKYSITTGELVWKKTLFAGSNASFNFSWAAGVYTLDNINNSGYGYQVGELLYIEGWSFSGGNGDNGLTIEVTSVTDTGGITAVTLTGTPPAGSGNIIDVYPANNLNQVDPTDIVYDSVNNQLLVLIRLWTGRGDNDDSWTRGVVLRVSPDTGAVIFSSALIDEGDVRPWAINVSADGAPVVAGQKFNEYRQLGTLTMLNTGNGYFDILKTDLDPEYYPGTATPGVYASDFWIEGTGIATKENVDNVNYYPSTITNGTAEGSGTVDVDLLATTAIVISTADLATATTLSSYVTINSDNIVMPGGWDSWIKFPSGTALATYMNANYTTNQVVPVTWSAGSTYTSDTYVIFKFDGDGTFDICPCFSNVLSSPSGPAAGTYYFPVEFVPAGLAVTVNTGGTGYKIGHKIKYLGTQIPDGATPANDIILTVTNIDGSGTITAATAQGTLPASNVSGLNSGTNYNVGTGATLDLTVDPQTASITVTGVSNPGSNYVVGDSATISGTVFANGVSPANDITITVSGVDGSGGITSAVTSNNPPIDALRILVNNVDFTAVGGSWTMKQNLGGEAFIWTSDWNKCIGGPTNDWFSSVTYSNDGQSHIYAVGSGRYDVNYDQSLVVKFDAANGDILWSKTINSFTNNSRATGVAPMNFSTDIIVTGAEYHIGVNRDLTFVARISATGSIVWKRFYNDYNTNWANYSNVQVDSQDNIYISTQYPDRTGWNNDAFNVLKLNQDGMVIWSRAVNSSGAASRLSEWDGTGWASFDETTQQLVVAGFTYSFDDNYTCGLWVGFPADGFTYLGGEFQPNQFINQGPWRFGFGGKFLEFTESTTSADFTPTPLASNIDILNNDKMWRTQDPFNKFPQWLTTMVDESNGGLVFGDGSKQTFATNIIPQVRAYQDYYLRPTDSGKHIYYGPNTNSGTIFIPYWGDVKLPVGFTLTIVNRCGGTIYVELQTGNQNGNIYGSGTTSNSRVWAIPDSGSGSMVTLMKVEEGLDFNGGVQQGDVWMISGPSDIYPN